MLHITNADGSTTYKGRSTIGAGGMLLNCDVQISRGNGRAVNKVETTVVAQTLLPGLNSITTNHNADGQAVTINAHFSQGNEVCDVTISGDTYTMNGYSYKESDLPFETRQLGVVMRGLAKVNDQVFSAAEASLNNMPANRVGNAADIGSAVQQQPTHTR